MSSTSNSQNLLVNVFRPVYTYSAESGFTPSLVLSNVDILSTGAIQTGQFRLGDSNNNIFLGSNAGGGSNNANNVGIGVGAMQSKSNSTGTVAIGTSALPGALPAIDTVAIGTDTTGGGTSNVILGARSGTVGSNMILLGSGLTTTGDVSGKLYIGSGGISKSLIFGDMNTRRVGINTDPATNFDVSGDMGVSRWMTVGYSPYQPARGAVDANGYIYANLGFQAQGGSAQYPAFTFFDDSGTGIYREGTDTGRFAITSQGTKRVDISGDTMYIYANLKATGSVNIGAVDTSAFSFSDGFVRDNATNPQTDVSRAGIRTTLVDVSTILQTSNGMIRVGPSVAPTVDISGSSIRVAQLYATNFVVSPFVHDGAAGTFDLSSGNLRLTNILRVNPGTGAIRVGPASIPTIDISGSNIRADGVVTTGSGTVGVPTHSFVADASLGLYRVGPSALGFASAGIPRMCISGGNVGIGKTTPVTALEVVGDVSATTYNGPGGTAGAPHYTFSDDRTTGVFFPSATQIGLTAGGTERMRISNAFIGIGTTAPTNALDVSGTMRVIGTGGTEITFTNGTINASAGVNVSGTPIVSVTGAFSNAATTSNSIGGVILSNTDISLTGKIVGAIGSSNNLGGVTLSNTTLVATTVRNATAGWTIDMSGGNLSNSATTTSSNFIGTSTASNSIGGVTLSNTTLVATTLRNALAGWTIDMSGGNLSNSATTTSSNFVGNATASNSIGGVTLSNTNLTLAGTITGSTATTSNSIGGVVLSNTTLAATTLRNATAGWTIDMSGGNLSNSATTTSSNFVGNATASNSIGGVTLSNTTLVATTLRNATSGFTIDMSGGNISNAATHTTDILITRNFYAPSTTDVSAISYINMGRGQNGVDGGSTNLQFLWMRGGGSPFRYCGINFGSYNTASFVTYNNGTGSLVTKYIGGLPTAQSTLDATQTALALTSSGNFGIGTTAPGASLDVSSTSSTTATFRNPNAAGQASVTVAGDGSTTGLQLLHNNGLQGLYNSNALPFTIWTSNSRRMTILPAGNVGIGLTDPSYALDVTRGSDTAKNFITAQFRAPASGTTQAAISITGGGWNDLSGLRILHSPGAAFAQGIFPNNTLPLQFGVNGAERMRIASDGTVGIGTANPAYPLDVSGTIRGSSNIVAVQTATCNVGTAYTSASDLSLTISYSPKQSSAANVTLIVQGNIDYYVSGGTGVDSYTLELRNGGTVLSTQAFYWSNDYVVGRGNSMNPGGGHIATVTVSGNVVSPINFRMSRTTGDDAFNYRSGYLVVSELSTT